MKLLSFDYGVMKKYIIYSDDNRIQTIHYVYKVLFDIGSTELTKYELGRVKNTLIIKSIVLFNAREPMQSVDRFYKILVLQP